MGLIPPSTKPSGREILYPVESLIYNRQKQVEKAASGLWEPSEWLLGYRIPPFQRPVVWSQEQMVRLIESIYEGIPIGTYTFNRNDALPAGRSEESRPLYDATDLWLIDGQQRLTAIDRYLSNEFPVHGYFWSDLTSGDHNRFGNQVFPATCITMGSEIELRRYYDRLNFGGTAHRPEDRALTPDGRPTPLRRAPAP